MNYQGITKKIMTGAIIGLTIASAALAGCAAVHEGTFHIDGMKDGSSDGFYAYDIDYKPLMATWKISKLGACCLTKENTTPLANPILKIALLMDSINAILNIRGI